MKSKTTDTDSASTEDADTRRSLNQAAHDSPCSRQKPSVRTAREITQFVRRHQRQLCYSPPEIPLGSPLNAKHALPAIRSDDDDKSSWTGTRHVKATTVSNSSSQRNTSNVDELFLMSLAKDDNSFINDCFESNGSSPKSRALDDRQFFQTIETLSKQQAQYPVSLQDAGFDIIRAKHRPQLPPIGSTSVPPRPDAPVPFKDSHRFHTSSEYDNDDDDDASEDGNADSHNNGASRDIQKSEYLHNAEERCYYNISPEDVFPAKENSCVEREN